MNGQRLRPLGLGDIFDEGFDLYKRNFVFLLLVTAITVVPLDIVIAWILPHLLLPLYDQLGITRTDQGLKWLVTLVIKLVFFLPVYALAVAPLVSAAAARYLDTEASIWAVYRQFGRRLPSLLLTTFLGGLALAFGFVCCVIPWLALASQFLFALHASVVENQGPGKALSRSSKLGGGYGGRAFSCLFLLGLILWIISLGLNLPLAYVFDSLLNITPAANMLYGSGVPGAGQDAEQEAVALLSGGLAHLLLIPFAACVVTVLYFDMRIRKEGFDIELLAQELHYPALAALAPHLPPAAVFVPMRPTYAPPPPRRGPPR